MLNITFFVNQSLECPAGSRYFPIAKNLVKLGNKVNIIALHPNYSSLKQKYIVKDGVNIYYAGQMHVLKMGDKKIYLNKIQLLKVIFLSTLNMFLKGLKLRSDVIYVFKPQPINGSAAFLTKLFKRNKFFVDCDDYEANSNKFSSKIEKLAFVLFEDYLPRFADLVTIHNSFLINRYKKLGINEKKILYLPNGVETKFFRNINKNQILKIKNKFNLKNKKIILYFGSLSLKSGHAIDLLLKSFPMVKKKIKNSLLLLVGGGEDFTTLMDYVNKKKINSIIFAGRVDKNEIPNYLKIADLTVDPVYDDLSNKARFPLKILESMASGIPVVTSDVGDRKIIIKNRETGLLVKAGNIDELAHGIIKILSNKELSNYISRNSKILINKYDWKKIVTKLNKSIIS